MPGPTESRRKWWVLAAACTGLAALMLDSTAVNLALPSIREDIDTSTAELQWVINVYLLVMAALMITAGRLGDIRGRRRVFLAGMVLFGLGAVIGGLAPDPVILIAARVVMGIGAAAILPLSLTLVNDAFPPSERGRAMGIWAAVSALALAFGPFVGGVLSEIDWRLIFFLNVPIVLAGVAIARWAATESRDETASTRIDVPGVITLTIGLGALVMGLIQAETWGWGSVATLALIGGGMATLVVFWLIEHRVGAPMVAFDLFRNGPYFGATAAAFAIVSGYWTLMFFFPQYFQYIGGFTPAEAGALILPMTLPTVLLSPFTARLLGTFGARLTMTVGMATGVVGLLVLTRIDGNFDYWLVFAGLLLFGIAMGLVYAPMSVAAMAAMPDAKAGIAAGVLGQNRIMSGAIALAATGALFQTLLREEIQSLVKDPPLSEKDAGELEGLASGAESAERRLAEEPESKQSAIESAVSEAFAFALSNALWIVVGITVIGAILTWAFVRDPKPRREPPPDQLVHHQHHRRFHL